jgi:hypothetical protein
MVKKAGWIGLILFIVFGIYFINAPFNFIPISGIINQDVNNWIVFIGGILMIVGGISFVRMNRGY